MCKDHISFLRFKTFNKDYIMSEENKENIENNQEENKTNSENQKRWWKKIVGLKSTYVLIYIGSFLFLFSILLIVLFDNNEQNMNYFKNKYEFRKLPSFKINRDVSSSSVLLSNGNILFSGGLISTHESTETTEIYNPIENKFYINASMFESRANHSSILLKNGDVLLTGGKKYSKDFQIDFCQ